MLSGNNLHPTGGNRECYRCPIAIHPSVHLDRWINNNETSPRAHARRAAAIFPCKKEPHMPLVLDAVREGIPDSNGALSVPDAKGPGIHVNEIGAGIVTDSAQFQIQAGFAQLARIASG